MGRTVSCNDGLRDVFYPLTLPSTVGPGSISVAITRGANEPPQSLSKPGFDSCSCTRLRDRGATISLLRVCRSLGARSGSDGNEGHCEAHFVPAGLDRSADRRERCEPVASHLAARRLTVLRPVLSV